MVAIENARSLLSLLDFLSGKFNPSLSFENYIKTQEKLKNNQKNFKENLKKNLPRAASGAVESSLLLIKNLQERLPLSLEKLDEYSKEITAIQSRCSWNFDGQLDDVLQGSIATVVHLKGILSKICNDFNHIALDIKKEINDFLIENLSGMGSIDVNKSALISELLESLEFKELNDLIQDCFEINKDFLNNDFANLTRKGRGFLVRFYQYKLNLALTELDLCTQIDNDTVLYGCKRVILTTKSAILGLHILLDFLQNNNNENRSLMEVTAEEVVTSLKLDSDHLKLEAFETAWALVSTVHKHQSDNIYVTTSVEMAKQAISQLTEANSTLVLDGHGKILRASIADFETPLMPTQLNAIIKELLGADIDFLIDHVVLQTCASGVLASDLAGDSFIKESDKHGKSTQFILSPKSSEGRQSPFTKVMADGQERQSVAEALYEGLGIRKSEVAFSFSQHLLNPGNLISDGLFGVEIPLDPNSPPPRWPCSGHTTPSPAIKRSVIVPSPNHRKCSSFFQVISPSGGSSDNLPGLDFSRYD